jgi:hypothetical protein
LPGSLNSSPGGPAFGWLFASNACWLKMSGIAPMAPFGIPVTAVAVAETSQTG